MSPPRRVAAMGLLPLLALVLGAGPEHGAPPIPAERRPPPPPMPPHDPHVPSPETMAMLARVSEPPQRPPRAPAKAPPTETCAPVEPPEVRAWKGQRRLTKRQRKAARRGT